MGGPGSGNFYRWDKKATVEECLELDVAALKRDGLIDWDRHQIGGLTWRNVATGEKTSNISYELNTLDRDRPWLRVFYTTTRRWNGEKIDSDYRIPLQVTRPHFGGYRWWLTCPLMVGSRPCLRRVRKLYIPPSGLYFGCRQCYDLTYRSCQESDKRVSALRRALLAGQIDPHQALDSGDVDVLLFLKAWGKLAGL